jgi:hypothetical protein
MRLSATRRATAHDLPVLGATWMAGAHEPRAGALTLVLGAERSLAGRRTPFGELLIDLSSPRIFTSFALSQAGVAVHARTIPDLVSLVDRPVFTQALTLGPPRFCNAIDLVLGR